MTTAARPTFEPAKGGMGRGERDLSALSKQYSSRDLPSHTRLKHREHGQATAEELRNRDFRRELEERERSTQEKRSSSGSSSRISSSVSSREALTSSSSSASFSSKKPRLDQIAPANLDADDPHESDESDTDDSDDDAELFRELEQIRQTRAEQAAKEAKENQEREEKIHMENIISGNPLLSIGAAAAATKADMKVRRRWDDDVIFKNCASSQPIKDNHFINDTLRSDFHKRFMEKYIK